VRRLRERQSARVGRASGARLHASEQGEKARERAQHGREISRNGARVHGKEVRNRAAEEREQEISCDGIRPTAGTRLGASAGEQGEQRMSSAAG
jgi:hypothetical protein